MSLPEVESLIHQHLFDLLFLIRIKMREVLSDSDAHLTPMQIVVLRLLAKSDDVPQAEIVKRTGRTKPQITRLIQGLEAMGVITRKRDPNDQRRFTLSLEPTAKAQTLAFIRYEEEIVSKMMVGVSDEQVVLLEELLGTMRANLRNL